MSSVKIEPETILSRGARRNAESNPCFAQTLEVELPQEEESVLICSKQQTSLRTLSVAGLVLRLTMTAHARNQ